MIRFTLAFVAGVLLFQYQPRLPHPGLFGAYLLLGVCTVPLRWCRLPAWLVIGFAWAHGHAWLTAPGQLPDPILDRPVWAEGRIDSLVDADALRTRFRFRVSRLEQDGRRYEGDWPVQVSWYRDAATLSPGERWRLKLKVKPVTSYASPGSFDHARWLYEQGVRYGAAVKKDSDNRCLAEPQGFSLTSMRQRLSDAMERALGGAAARSAALLRALVVGDRSGFSQTDWEAFRATGTNHLVAISGLHIGLVAGLVMGLVAWSWRRMPWLCNRWPALLAGATAGWMAALVYAGMAGFAIPTQRALLMLTVGLLALLTGRLHRAVDGLAMSLLLVVAWSPMAVNSAGTWLSFAAVGLILLAAAPGNDNGRARWKRWGRAQLAVSLGLIPLLVLLFQQASVAAPVVNLLAIPWFSLLLVPLGLLASLAWLLSADLGEILWRAWHWLAGPALDVLDGTARWPWVELSLPSPGPLVFVLAMLGVALLLSPRGMPARWLGLVLFLPLAINRPASPSPGGYEMTLLDVGQGLAVVLRTHGYVLVYDAGPRYLSGFNTGDAVVLPFLRQLGIGHIDTLLISHADLDHAGGAPALLRAMPVKRLLAGEPEASDGAELCLAGQHWRWDGVDFTILSPGSTAPRGGNNGSCVLRVDGPGGSLLLTADIETEAEKRLLASGALSPVTVVVVPHHGSRSSSSPGFVRALQPRHALYATGQHNRWGFPKAEVVGRWRAQGATGWDTAQSGAITVRFPADGSALRLYTHRRRHYWEP